LRERIGGVASSLANLTAGRIDGTRALAMIDAYANTPSLAEHVLSLAILDESLRQLAVLARDGG